jgi:hypothetical protein
MTGPRPYDVVWTTTLAGGHGAPVVHSLQHAHLRDARADEIEAAAYEKIVVSGPSQRVAVMAVDCGVAKDLRLLTAMASPRFGDYDRTERSLDLGVRLLAKYATAIGARWCRHCWPDGVE